MIMFSPFLTLGAVSLTALMIPYTVQLRRETRRTHRAAERSDREKRQFALAVGHEIRNPLQAIHGMAELLLQNGLTPEIHAQAVAIRDAADALHVSVTNLRAYSSDDPIPLQIGMFDLPALISSIRDTLECTAKEKGCEIYVSIEPHAPHHIDSDAKYVRQIVANVVDHALGLSVTGSRIELKVHARDAATEPETVKISVTDRDAGSLDANARSILFEPFGAQHVSQGIVPPGTGLHLYVARSFARLLGGEVQLSTPPEGGVCYDIELPVRIWDVLSSSATGNPDVLVSLRDQFARHRGELPPQRVLVAEDQRSNQQVLASLLGSAGHHVTIAGTGEEALQRLSRDEFDVVLVDLHLPGMHGFEVMKLARVNGAPGNRNIPLVVITGDSAPDIRQRSEMAGAAAFLAKPVSSTQLLNTLATVMQSATPKSAQPYFSDAIDVHALIGNADPMDFEGVIPRKVADALRDALHYLGEMERAADRADWSAVQLRCRALRGAAYVLAAVRVVEAVSEVLDKPVRALPDVWPQSFAGISQCGEEARHAISDLFRPQTST